MCCHGNSRQSLNLHWCTKLFPTPPACFPFAEFCCPKKNNNNLPASGWEPQKTRSVSFLLFTAQSITSNQPVSLDGCVPEIASSITRLLMCFCVAAEISSRVQVSWIESTPALCLTVETIFLSFAQRRSEHWLTMKYVCFHAIKLSMGRGFFFPPWSAWQPLAKPKIPATLSKKSCWQKLSVCIELWVVER